MKIIFFIQDSIHTAISHSLVFIFQTILYNLFSVTDGLTDVPSFFPASYPNPLPAIILFMERSAKILISI